MLRVIEGDHRPDDRVTLADVPLGPRAGAQVEVWASKTGNLWHGDPGCGSLRSRAKHAVHGQPPSGILDDVALPERVHCDPPDRLGAYRRAARSMVAFDAVTFDAAAALRNGDLNLAVLEPPHRSSVALLDGREAAVSGEFESGGLAELWARCCERRMAVVGDARRELEARLPMMLAAEWVASGRTPRQHQDRYARFLEVAEQQCGARQISASLGVRLFANDRVPDLRKSLCLSC